MDILQPPRKHKGWIMYTVEPPLTATSPLTTTSLQRPLFWRTVHTLALDV